MPVPSFIWYSSVHLLA